MCGSNLIILSLPLSQRGWREIEIETERERVAIHVAIGFVMLWFLSLSLSLARPLTPNPLLPPPPPLSHSFSISLSHTHARQTLSLSLLCLSLSVCLSLPQLHSLLCCKFICCVKQQLAREWALGFDPFVKHSPCECVLRPPAHHGTGRLALSNIAVPSWVYHDRASHLAEMGGTMRCWRFDGVSHIHMWTSVQSFLFIFSNILIVVLIVCVVLFCWWGPPHLPMLVSSVLWNYHIHGLHSIKSQSVKGPARSVCVCVFLLVWGGIAQIACGEREEWREVENTNMFLFFGSKLFHSYNSLKKYLIKVSEWVLAWRE